MNKFFTLISLLLSCATLLAQDATNIFKDRVSSTVTVRTANKDGDPIGHGSGFFINKNIVATSYHVIEGADQAIIETADGERHEVKGYINADQENDIILLRVDYDSGVPLEVMRKKVDEGERIYVISTPESVILKSTISDGLISGKRMLIHGDKSQDTTFLLQITAPVSPGSSGAPVLDKDGFLVGIVRFQFEEGQNLNFAVHAEYVQNLARCGSLFTKALSKLSGIPAICTYKRSEKEQTKPSDVSNKATSTDASLINAPTPSYNTTPNSPNNEPNLAEYQSKALQKVYELENYLIKIGNKQTNAIDARNATDLAVSLFTNEDRTVEVSSSKRTTKNFYRIREYLNRMRTMPYDNVRVSWSNVSYISNLRKGMDDNYYGIISFDQYFEGIKDGKVTYRDQTRKNVEVVLKSQNMYRNGESIPYWDVFLSDIGVVSTQ